MICKEILVTWMTVYIQYSKMYTLMKIFLCNLCVEWRNGKWSKLEFDTLYFIFSIWDLKNIFEFIGVWKLFISSRLIKQFFDLEIHEFLWKSWRLWFSEKFLKKFINSSFLLSLHLLAAYVLLLIRYFEPKMSKF